MDEGMNGNGGMEWNGMEWNGTMEDLLKWKDMECILAVLGWNRLTGRRYTFVIHFPRPLHFMILIRPLWVSSE